MSYQAWQIASPGKLNLATLDPIPKPGPKQVLVRIHAAALNYRDILVVDHNPNYLVKAKDNLIPGADGAGEIHEVGEGSGWKRGDRVIVHPNSWMTGHDVADYRLDKTTGGGDVDGTFTQYMLLDDDRVFKAPAHLTFEEACTVVTAGVTAYNGLFYGEPRVSPGTTVLTQGTGGVSCYAIMIAAAAGATVIATSSSDEKLEVARKLGATHLINYKTTPEWSKKVLELTNGVGVDIVVDVVGADMIEETVQAVRFGGRVSYMGMLSKEPNAPKAIFQTLLFKAITIKGILGAGSRTMSEELAAFMEKHEIRPPVAQVFEWEQAPEALQALTTLSKPGKLVIKI